MHPAIVQTVMSLNNAPQLTPAWLKGFRRCWDAYEPEILFDDGLSRPYAVLTLRPCKSNPNPSSLHANPMNGCNGVLIPIPPNAWKLIDAYEDHYDRVDVTQLVALLQGDQITPLNNEDNSIITYRGQSAYADRPANTAIITTYQAACEQAARLQGQSFYGFYQLTSDSPPIPVLDYARYYPDHLGIDPLAHPTITPLKSD